MKLLLNKILIYFKFFKLNCISIFLWLVANFCLFSQNEFIQFKSITTADGLSHSNISSIYQDGDGYIWIGTGNGLNRYNGISFETFFYIKNDTSSISGNYINCIYEDEYKNLWLGTSNGLCRFNRDLQNFERYNYIYDIGEIGANNSVSAIYRDSNHKLWIATYNGVFYLDSVKHRFISPFSEEIKSNFINYCGAITEDNNKNIWFIIEDIENGGLFKYSESHDTTIQYNTSHPEIKLRDNQVTCLTFDSNNNLWVGYTSSGIDIINIKTHKTTHYSNKPGDPNSLSNDNILCLAQYIDGRILIGTNGGGLDVFDLKTKRFSHHTQTKSDRSLLNNSIQTIFVAPNGMILIGCWGGGVNIFDKRYNKFTLYNQENQQNNNVSLKAVTCFAEDKYGNIWISTDGGGINCFNPLTKDFVNFRIPGNNKVLALEIDNKNELWAGMWNGGICHFKITNKNLILIKRFKYLEKTDKSSNNVFKIYKDNEGIIWAGTFEDGIYTYNSKTEKFEKNNLRDTLNIQMDKIIVRNLLEDYKGNIWISTEVNGLFVKGRKPLNSRMYISGENDLSNLPSSSINLVHEDSWNRIWVGTDEGGLSLLNEDNKTFTNYTTEEGLPDNTIVGILEDNRHNLWLSSYNGLTKAKTTMINEKLNITFKNYSVKDGLQDGVFNRWAYFKSSTGEMYFGGNNGFNVFHPDKVIDNQYPPPVYLTDFLLFYKPVPIGKESSPLKKHISQTKKIILNHKQSIFTIKFIALNYIYSEKNQYAYMMEGFEDDWNYVGDKREATYTNLDYGEYVFRVKASNNDNIWNETGTSVILEILPPWWKTLWFKTIFFLTIMGGLISLYFVRISTLKNQKRFLEAKISERTKMLEKTNMELNDANTRIEEVYQQVEEQSEELKIQKENLQKKNNQLKELNATKDKFFSIIAHDIKNPFNSILGYTDQMVKHFNEWNNEEKFDMVKNVYSSSKQLFELIANLLQWSITQRGKLSYNPVNISLKDHINDAVSILKQNATDKNINIALEPENTDITINADKNMFDTIIRNLLSNAIKFTNSGGKVTIRVKKQDNCAFISVSDNGIGMDKEMVENLFRLDVDHKTKGTNNEEGSGLGLLLIQEFVKRHCGNIYVKSEQGKGSTFTFSIPLKQ